MISKIAKKTNLNENETVVLYPSYGHREKDGRTWKINVAGTVFEPGHFTLRKRILLRLLQRVMKAPPEAYETELFQQRIESFISNTEKGKWVAVRVGNREYLLQKKTKRNGQFRGVLHFTDAELQELKQKGDYADGWLQLDVVTACGEKRKFLGRVQLLDQHGISVISDIDDTIKLTEVTCRRSLLANTFTKDFQSIEGMSDLYQAWAKSGAVFHYVSSSPWQLFNPLSEFCDQDDFPSGTFHLRSFRLRDHMMRRMLLIRRPGKGVVIKSLLKTFPKRQFVLVGDSGERDPELYGAAARKYRRNVAAIFIRELPDRPMTAGRCEKAFKGVSPDIWSCFNQPSQLTNLFPKMEMAASNAS